MEYIISGTFRMVIRGGSPQQLYFDDDFLKIMDIEDRKSVV